MKFIINLVWLFACITFLFSCEKDDSDSDDLFTRIETETVFDGEVFSENNTYKYDENGKIIEELSIVDYMVGPVLSKYVYNGNQVFMYEYTSESDTPYIYINYLNSEGLVDSTISTYNNLPQAKRVFIYDTEGYLIKQEFKSDSYRMYFYNEYEIKNGNISKAIYKMAFGTYETSSTSSLMLPDQTIGKLSERMCLQKRTITPDFKSAATYTEYIDTAYYEYLNKSNTISDVNKGNGWSGLPNKNLVSRVTYKTSEGETHTTDYGYEFDKEDRVIKRFPTAGDDYITTYTYTH